LITESPVAPDRDRHAMTDPERVSTWARRVVFTGALFLPAWQLAAVAGAGRRVGVILGLLGFVFHTAFGKAYSLVPTYFERELVTARLMPAHLGCSGAGTLLLAADASSAVSIQAAGAAGGTLWALAVLVFVGTVLATIRDNLTGAETGTGEHNADRRRLDRVANLGVPAALLYLLVGSYELLAVSTGLPALFDGYPPRAFHLLAVGTGALLVFAIGFRLLPRFLATSPPERVAILVIPAGILAPPPLAAGLPAGRLLRAGALLVSVAMLGYAGVVTVLVTGTDRDRVGIYGVAAGAVAGVLGVTLGLGFAFADVSSDLVTAHRRLNVLGFLGLTIVGVSYQFYPPGVVSGRVDGETVALAAIGCLAGALGLELLGAFVSGTVADIGLMLALVGATLHTSLLAWIFRWRYGNG